MTSSSDPCWTVKTNEEATFHIKRLGHIRMRQVSGRFSSGAVMRIVVRSGELFFTRGKGESNHL